MAKIFTLILVSLLVKDSLCDSYEFLTKYSSQKKPCGKSMAVKEEVKEKSCGCKPEVFYHRLKPIYVDTKPKHVNIDANNPVIVQTPPVIIRKSGLVEVRPIIAKHQPKDKIIPKKIVKVVRPVYKKFFEEKFVKKEYPCPEETIEVVEEKPKFEYVEPPCPYKEQSVEVECGCNDHVEKVEIKNVDVKKYKIDDFDINEYL